MKSPIRIQDLTISFGEIHALKNLTTQIDTGQFYALVGKNGAGKSTLIRALAKQEKIKSGFIEFDGLHSDVDDDQWGSRVGFVSENTNFHYFTAEKIASILKQFYSRWDDQKWRSILSELGIKSDQRFIDLSRGQKMQVATAMMFSQNPDLYLLDEITAVLDARARVILLHELREQTLKGKTVILATNLVSEIDPVADRMLLLVPGLAVENIRIDEIGSFYKKRVLTPEQHKGHTKLTDGSVWVGTERDGRRTYVSKLSGNPSNADLIPTPEEVFTFLSFFESQVQT